MLARAASWEYPKVGTKVNWTNNKKQWTRECSRFAWHKARGSPTKICQ